MKKILIVEDDQLVATAYKKRFLEAGYDVEWAPDGLEGIKSVTALKPDVVLLDLLMPRLDGIEVLKYIRGHAELKHLPVVVFSNSYMTNLVENAWRAGADQCLMKASTTPAQLFVAVDKAMQKAASRAQMPAAPAPDASRPIAVTPLIPPAAQLTSAPPNPLLSSTPLRSAPFTPLGPRPSTAAAPFVAPVVPLAKASPASHPQLEKTPLPVTSGVDPEFQAQIRELFLAGAGAKLLAVRDAATAFVQDQGSSMQLPLLSDLFRKVHSLTGNAAVAGCSTIAHYASTFEALLQELQQKPKFINISTVRSVLQAVEFLDLLFQNATPPMPPPSAAPAVMVIDADAVSSQAITLALETAGYTAVVAAEPGHALVQMSSQKFCAVILAASLPGMSGFELCPQIQALPGYGQFPMLFVTSLQDFPAHAVPEVLGENDLIASPFLLIELTLKAVTHVEWGRLAGRP